MPAPKVSICIPAYKQPKLIARALESVQAQLFTDYEIIITDDSPDDSVEISIKQFSFGNKLKYFRNAKPLGSPENWNEAVRHATGEYIKILHHDDWLSFPDSLAGYVEMLNKNSGSDFAFSATRICNSEGMAIRSNNPSEEKLKEIMNEPALLFLGNVIGAPSATIYRRNINIEFDKNIKYVVDIDFYIRILIKNTKLIYSEKELICNTSGAEFQVTNDCLNKNAQLYENGYLYNKYSHSLFKAKKYRRFFKELFYHYNVKSVTEFIDAGVAIPDPAKYFKRVLLVKNLKEKILKLMGRA